MKTFSDVFGGEPEASADAPGRVNLLGEHTDYSEGFVLPAAIAQRTRVTLRRRLDAGFTVYSANLDQSALFTLDAPPPEAFARYVYGCVRELAGTGARVPNLDIHVASDVPIGVGLSSSAALEVATLRALHRLLRLDIDPVRIAQLAHRAENDHAGVRCGILDQMACSLLDGRGMLFLDTRTLDRKLVPLPEGSQVVVVDSGVQRELVSSAYNVRRAECEEASRLLGVRTLRDARDEAAIEALPEPWRRRALHVVTENRRASRGAEGVDARTFGALMAESHRSLKDNFEVSIPAMDELVADLMTVESVFGAKLTGAGFGGACVALCSDDDGVPDIERVLESYNKRGRRARVSAVVR
jgi:galactokinase